VGERWRDMWMERLENEPFLVIPWLSHPHRDDYWKHGSVCEDFDAIEIPVYMVGGWIDGYPNAVPRFLEGASGPRKGLIGPWAHLYPHHALPGPEIGFLQECLRFWDHCLKGVDNGIMDEPMLRAWIEDPVEPLPGYAVREGRWVAEPVWPPVDPGELRLHLNAEGLGAEAGGAATLEVASDERQGRDAGNWIGWGRDTDWPTDQRAEDALSLTFDSAPLEADVDALGFVDARLRLAADRPSAFVAVRLCEVDPEGRSTLVTRGILNLSHRRSHEHPEPMEPGRFEDVDVRLKVIGHRFAAGNRLRIAISPAYWPWIWPSPTPVRLSLETGAASWVSIPARAPRPEDDALAPFDPPEAAPPPPFTRLPHGPMVRTHLEDIGSGRLEIVNDFDFFGCRRLPDGLEYTEHARDRFTIVRGDPLSAKVECDWEMNVGRDDWRTRVEASASMTSTATHFVVTNVVEAYEGEVRVFVQTRTREIPRDLV
jgi:predicted acyl esterase